jgi:hypothetical protein
MDDGATDAVLQVLSTTDEALTTDQICARVGSNRTQKDVRVALRDLADQGEVIRLDPNTWRGRSLAKPAHKPKTDPRHPMQCPFPPSALQAMYFQLPQLRFDVAASVNDRRSTT